MSIQGLLYRQCTYMPLVHICTMHFGFNSVHSEEQCVILQKLSVVIVVIVEVLVCDKFSISPAFRSLSLGDAAIATIRDVTPWCPYVIGVVFLITQLVEQAHFHSAYEWPHQVVVIVSSHHADQHRHIGAFPHANSVCMHTETHLVPSKMGVHRIAEPHFIPLLLLLKSFHLDDPRWAGIASGRVLEPGTEGERELRILFIHYISEKERQGDMAQQDSIQVPILVLEVLR